MKNFEKRLLNRGCPTSVVEKHLSEVKFSDRKSSLNKEFNQRTGMPYNNIALCNAIPPGLVHRQLREIFTEPPLISYRKGKSLKDILVREKL